MDAEVSWSTRNNSRIHIAAESRPQELPAKRVENISGVTNDFAPIGSGMRSPYRSG
jgi:hypothetical protein